MQRRLQAVLRSLRYVGTAVAIGAWFVSSLRGVRRRSGFKREKHTKTNERGARHGAGINPEKLISPSVIKS